MARKNAVEKTAALWASLHNRMMDGWGYGPESHITHLSYAARGIDRIPQIHEGAASRAMAERGEEGAAKPEWHHIDHGHSRAEANAVIKEINAIKEADNEQTANDTDHRLGGDHDHDRTECEGRGQNDRARGGRVGGSPGQTGELFEASERIGKGGRGNQGETCADSRAAAKPPFLADATPPAPPHFAPDRRLRRRGRLRRVFRELVMLRDTLRARLFRDRRVTARGHESHRESAPVVSRPRAREVERE
ncbi:MobA/MobL family protein [Pseudoponticoccus marisrubri]|uniref:MobA/MobL family protein n=1 Tax=Pseudoponticoccus marisrubri TaxID=1685382 RepID=UPI001F0B4677